jgi:type II secretory pathway predicted ATPase ExeA
LYQDYYQLSDDPFRLSSDALSACLHQQFKQTLKTTVDAINKGAGVVYVTGRTGIGKTMLLKSLTEDQPQLKVLLNTTARLFNEKGLISLLFDSEGSNNSEQTNWLAAFEDIMEKQDKGVATLITVDDAHDLSDVSLSLVGQAVKLIEVRGYRCCFILAGNNKINPPDEGFPPHLLLTTQLDAIRHDEMDSYVLQRLKVVGGDSTIQFDESVWEYLFQLSDGVPRRINRICNRLLLNGMFDEKEYFDKQDMILVAKQLDKEGLLELSPEIAAQLDLVGTNPETMGVRPVLDMKAFYQAYQSTPINSIQKYQQKAAVPPVLNDTVMMNTQVLSEVAEPVAAEEPFVLFPDDTDFKHTSEPEKKSVKWIWSSVFLLVLTGLIIYAGIMIYKFIDADFVNEMGVAPTEEKPNQSTDVSPQSQSIEPQSLPADGTQSAETISEDMTELKLPLVTPPTKAEALVEPPAKTDVLVEPPAKAPNSSLILSALLYKALLQDNHWQKNYKPAILLPSTLNECDSSGDDIYCLTRTRQTQSENVLYSYKTGAMIQDFRDDGTFYIMYRSSITRTENPNPANLGLESSLEVPIDTKERRMQCEFVSGTMIKCAENRMVSIYTRELPSQPGENRPITIE